MSSFSFTRMLVKFLNLFSRKRKPVVNDVDRAEISKDMHDLKEVDEVIEPKKKRTWKTLYLRPGFGNFGVLKRFLYVIRKVSFFYKLIMGLLFIFWTAVVLLLLSIVYIVYRGMT